MSLLSKLFRKKENTLHHNALAFMEVDMHNHLLPGIDDGSKSVEQSVKLIEGLQELGLNKFICTPHIMDGVYANTKDTIDAAYQKLKSTLVSRESKVELNFAAEHMIDQGLDVIIADNKLCGMPNDYVLIEMSYLAESKSLFRTIMDIQAMGYKPILAHPERYNYYHQNFKIFKQIKDAGCALQLNLLSVSRYYGSNVKTTALTLIKSGLYDFIGTDIHHEKHLAAVKEVATKYPLADLLKTCQLRNHELLTSSNPSKEFIAVG
ncbi:tyrosine-protein phosphatase [Sphingobacterium spiritivorum]|uniref:tyrosine-protein phosphatase n=1 Tax=Sphingobacterium spiritivorum TaxID=258 RepID=UPI00191B0D4A|nr:CpsB/CapC family capsule biosynthesis tyrosine phosphatase [Sphingobacterium spiritivorum]QQT27820.1 protein tyrosine phosphatase [Sphingobacterium spiritivorum]